MFKRFFTQFNIIHYYPFLGAIHSKKYQDGKGICQRLRDKIEKGDITLDFVKELDKEKEKVSMLCASVLGEQTSAPSFEDKITELMYAEDDCSKKIELLESTINYGKGLWIEVYSDALNENDSVIETFDNLKKTSHTRKVNELQNHDKFWGKLLPLLDQAEVLYPWLGSISFRAVTKTGLKESSKLSSNEDENKSTTVSDLNSFISFLATKTLGIFHAQWTAVLNDPYSCSLATMSMLLGSFQDQDRLNQNRLDQELKLVKNKLGRRNCSPDVKSCIDDFVNYPNVLKQIKQVIKIFKIFKLENRSKEAMTVLLQFLTTSENSNNTTLGEVHELIEKANEIMASFSGEDLDGVIEELSTSATLLDFIEDIVDEDIRFLIDAVEEHSDQFVSESLVSYFIDVHSFLASLIKTKNEKVFNLQEFLRKVEKSCLRHKDIAKKIEQCSKNVNSLLGLYRSIANRGELTKEIIGNCLSKGEYWVSQKDAKSEAKMSYVLQENGENNMRNYYLSDLHDLRSRALLIVSSQKKSINDPSIHSNKSSKDIDFEDFITQVNLLTEIWTLLTKLCSSGYLIYQNFEQKIKTTHGLKSTRDSLKRDLENWENELKTAREKFYFLNYYYSDQICTLYNFLINGSKDITDEVLSLVHFVDRTVTKQQLEPHQKSPKMLEKSGSNVTPNLLLSTVGEALEKIFEESQPAPKSMPNVDQSQSHIKLEDRVTEGEIFVSTLEPESPLTANVLLALYESTSKAFPEPYQIVFCSSQTTWEEIHLLLQRCFTHSERRYHERLFCIVNVELLTNELQFKLVNEIKGKEKCIKEIKEKEKCIKEIKEKVNCCQNGDYQLALICRGGDHHHVVEQFAQNSHKIAGMSDLALAGCLKSGWPDVKMITSSLPGLGKTEQIKHEVLEKGMNVATFLISGPFKSCKLIKRLKKLKLQTYHCLHLDIGEVSDPLLLDTFLFQLIVTGMVSAGNQFYHLPPKTHMYMEIANTLKDSLRESLVVSKYFTRIHLEWQNYKNLLVSNDITSDVQVVCQYLDVFDRGRIESGEVHFSEPNKSKPLSTGRCQELLAKYFSSDADVTFTMLRIFLAVLAEQLLKFSKSAFFKVKNIKFMAGHEATSVRKDLFQALLSVSKQFASRAIKTSCPREISISQKESAVGSTTTSALEMVERVTGMIQWEDNNHLVVVFQGLNSQAITAIYREQSLVPKHVKKLLKSQAVGGNGKLEDLKDFTQEQLKEKLEKIACTKSVEKKRAEEPAPSYALTPDNILKMVLIILRIRVNVPVIIMGETGCGKTSLVRYLANTRRVEFCSFHFHAGISEEEIIAFIKEKERHAKDIKEQMWICLDEINTCDHLGLINDIMCHHSLLGRPLSKNLVFLATCNPYKLRSEDHIKTAGLEGKNITDQYSKLVYRVYPLPEAMIDYVWDFGSLGPKDERAYIERMVGDLSEKDMVVDLLVASQIFIRKAEQNNFCVSLRDVNRCIRLIKWFEKMRNKPQKANANTNTCSEHLKEYKRMSEEYNEKPTIKSIVLALAHCYLSRLPTAELRKEYRTEMMNIFSIKDDRMTCNESLDTFAAILRMEEEDYLDRMELPPGTARNAALRENVFVVLVCILNRIPIFVVGKPGCSKSLSIHLIRSNLRGRDSKDPWFQELPKLYVVSYQGSESSTSEGIIKIFEKAHKYKLDNNALPVVLLDEVGLAENSKNNPLKVLHSLLEPSDGKLPDVAVVGISNWSLDAAKMNRAIYLSRPEPTKDDLYETGHSLHYAEDQDNSQYLTEKELECLAEAYFDYQNQQRHANFHGLRDYYALIKSLTICSNLKEVNISLQRNFGGLPGEVTNIQKIFLGKLKKLMVFSSQDDPVLKIIPVTELIQANLKDLHARHLMLITSGDSAIGILKQSLAELEKETITIYGSLFEEDLSEEYNYRILSRIILYMEQDCILILKDLESIYGSLYDMLNQNYTVVRNKKNCRVALGPYSNPMCQVHDGFRCIVLIDQHKVDYSDPPFLNRFEKQVLRYSDVLTKDEQSVITELQRWVQGMSTVEGLETHFRETDLFIGFHEDTLPSLVRLHCRDTDSTPEKVLKKCKDELMWIASPDGVLRTQKCKLFQENCQQVQELSDEYFRKPLHQGFTAFIQHVVTNHQKPFFAGDEIGSKTVVMTFSSITDIRQCLQLGNGLECQDETLSSYKSEKLLSERISEFWETAKKELLVLQCKPELDGKHLMLARCIIEEKRNSYKKCVAEKDRQGYKHVCIVVHVQREAAENSVLWQFNFLSGWKQVFLDVLEAPPVPLKEIRGQSAQKLLTSSIWPIHRITRNDLLWCFTCIKYTRGQRSLDTVLHIAKNLFSSKEVSQVIEKLILQSIRLEQDEETNSKGNWQIEVACDRQSLVNSSTLYSALERFVSKLVRNTLAKIVFFLEKENSWPPHVVDECNETLQKPCMQKLEDLWCKLIMDSAIFKIEDIPEPLGAESCLLNSASLDLHLPFSQMLYKKIDRVKEPFLEHYASLKANENNFDDNGKLSHSVQQQQLVKFSKKIIKLIPKFHCYTLDCYDLYMKDVLDIVTADFSVMLDRSQRISIAKAAFISEVKQNLPAKDTLEFCTLLHTFVWLHQEQIFHLMRLVECCQSLIPVLLNKTDDVFCSSQEVVFVKNLKTDEGVESSETDIECQQDDNRSNPRAESKTDEMDVNEKKLADVVLDFEEVSADFPGTIEEILGEKIEQCEDLESFGDYLVMTCCEEMFPSQEIVDKNGGLDSWITNASLLLSLGFKISGYSPAFHYLRFCVDFSRIICTVDSLSTNLSFLFTLNQIGINLRPEYLDHLEAFKMITNQIIKPLKEQIEDHNTDEQEALQKFSALFYGRCIDTNLDTSSARPIVEQVLSMDKPQLVMIMSPVVLRLLMGEVVQRSGVFVDLITNPHVIEESACLRIIDVVFKGRFAKKMIHHDSYPAVMICDLIQCLLHFEDQFKIEDIDSSDCKVLQLARYATRVVSQNSEGDCGLRILSAVAFLRGFFTMVAKFVAGNPSVLNEENPYMYVMVEVNSLLNVSKLPLQMFFMKQLYENASLFYMQKWFRESNSLSSIEELWRGEKMQKKAKLTSVLNCPEYKEAKTAYFTLKEKDDESSMQEFLKECTTSPEHRFALLGVLINMVYLERAVRKLGDKEEQLVDRFAEKVVALPPLFQKLLLRVIGRCDFHCSELQLSPESSVKEVEMALLVLHIACVVATGADEDLPIYQYLTNPGKCEQSYVLAHCEEEIHSVFEYRSTVKESVCLTCTCSSRLAFNEQVDQKVCPHCHAVLNGKSSSSTSLEASATLSKSFNGRKSLAWDHCTKQMNPAAYHALRLIVYSSYYAGIALDISSEESLLTALNRLHGDDFDTDFTSAANFCFENVKSDLSCLMTILSCKESVAIKTMHLVVDKSSDLIRSNHLLSRNDFSKPEMLREWEAKFSQLTETVFSIARDNKIEEMKLLQTKGSQKNANTLECCILERDGYPEVPTEQNKQLKRLFRVTKEPSFEDFRSAFLYSSEGVQVKHSFLTLFFAKFDQLSMIRLLHHLLKWSRIVSSSLTLRISRKDAQSKSNSFDDFIKGNLLELHRSEQERESLKKSFDKFTEAWNRMRDPVNRKLVNEEKMPRLTVNDCVAYCLTESDFGMYLKTAIDILVSYQNSILDAIISLSSSRQHPVLSFLENENCSGVASISIQNVKENEIINFQWSDDLFNQHAQNNPEYGKGRKITYDFERIEMELVNEIVFGKYYLTGTLNKFIFAKELFHSCGPLLTEIRSLVKMCSDLPGQVLKGLAKLKEQRSDAQDLLQHIEVLIYLLKRKLKDINVDMTVEELVKEWSTMLPSPFPVNLLPQPKSSIKVEHIAALYEAVEDVLADGAVEGLHDKFRVELSGDMKKLVNDMVGKDIIHLKPQHFLKVLRRFVFRYLSSGTEKYWPEENAALQSCLQETSLWVPLQPPDPEEIPLDITLRHIYSVMKHLMELLKVSYKTT